MFFGLHFGAQEILPGQPGPAWPPNKSWIMEDHEGTLARGRVDRGILSNCITSPKSKVSQVLTKATQGSNGTF